MDGYNLNIRSIVFPNILTVCITLSDKGAIGKNIYNTYGKD